MLFQGQEFFRDDVVVVLNFSHAPKENYTIGMPAAGLWKLRLNSDATVYSNDFQRFFSGDVEALGRAGWVGCPCHPIHWLIQHADLHTGCVTGYMIRKVAAVTKIKDSPDRESFI